MIRVRSMSCPFCGCVFSKGVLMLQRCLFCSVWAALLRLSIRSTLFTLGVVAVVVGLGVYGFMHITVDAIPDITNNQVQVYAYGPGYSAAEMELLVTRPLEQALATVPKRIEWRSISRTGLSLITLVFPEEEDPIRARSAVYERLGAVSLPPGVQAELGPLSTGLSEAYQYYLRPKAAVSLQELRLIQDWVIRRELLNVPGVADVSSFGGSVRRWEILIDPAALLRWNLTLQDLEAALQKSNQLLGGGYIEKQGQTMILRIDGLWRSAKEIAKTVVGVYQGRPLLLQDIARIQEGSLPRYGALVKDTLGEVVGGIVLVRRGENTARVVTDLKARIAALTPRLPYGIQIIPFLDREALIHRVIRTVTQNLVEAALIVIGLLTFLLASWRAGLLVGLVIPLSMLFALGLMQLSGVSANLMSLGAIDFGLIVDGTVILIEAVLVRMRFQPNPLLAAEEASIQIRQASLFGELIVLSVYLPLLFLRGVEGKLFRPMVLTMIYALIGALVLSLTLIPWLSARFLRPSAHSGLAERFFGRLSHWFWGLYRWSARRPAFPIAVWVGWVGIGTILLFQREKVFIPELDEGDFAVETRLPLGQALSQTIFYTQQLAKTLLTEMGWAFSSVVAKIGTSEIPLDPMFVESADMIVHIRPEAPLPRARLADSLKALLTSRYPGIFLGVQQPIQMRFNELLAGARMDIVVKLLGPDLDTLLKYGEQLADLCARISGVSDLSRPLFFGAQTIEVRWRPELMLFYEVDLAEAQKRVQAFRVGLPLSWLYEGEKRIPVALRLDGEPSLASLQALPIPTKRGGYVTLSTIADITFRPAYNEIPHADGQRAYVLGINVRGRGAVSVVAEIQQQAERLSLPPGYYLHYGGQWQNYLEARARLLWIAPLTIGLVVLLMYLTLDRWQAVGLILLFSLSAPAGGMIALTMRGLPFSISAAIGLISVLGLATLQGTVLVNRLHALGRGGHKPIYAWKAALYERIRPIWATTLVASAGFLPMAFSTQAGAEVQRPLATVVLGGLLVSAFFTLWLLPLAYNTKALAKLSKL